MNISRRGVLAAALGAANPTPAGFHELLDCLTDALAARQCVDPLSIGRNVLLGFVSFRSRSAVHRDKGVRQDTPIRNDDDPGESGRACPD